MKLKIFGITISSASRVYERIIEARIKGYNKTRPELYYYVLGVWDSRIFGICVYRNAQLNN